VSTKDKKGRPICHCGGYWFPHRKGGGACDHSKTQLFHLALRRGEDELDAFIEQAFFGQTKPHEGECPF